MKILHLSTYDSGTGAARGAYWLHRALADRGVDSSMLVARKTGNDKSVLGPSGGMGLFTARVRGRLDNLPLSLYEVDNFSMFSPGWVPTWVHRTVHRMDPDLVHLHWICNGFLSPADIARMGRPVVWTMRDMWAFTGGCHNTRSCDLYTRNCGTCPHLNSEKTDDLSRKTWDRKAKAWSRAPLHPVASSRWLAQCARTSSLFGRYTTRIIPNAVDETVFHPVASSEARRLLGLPQEDIILLFGSINSTTMPLKGFEYVKKAVEILMDGGHGSSMTLVIFGARDPDRDLGLAMKNRVFGRLSDDEKLRLLYSAGDVMLFPSVQEAFGKAAIEAMACGTPVVCFDTSGLKDVVDHMENGYRATCYEPQDLVEGVTWLLLDRQRLTDISRRCREKVLREYTLKIHAQRYEEMYREVLEGEAPGREDP